MAPTREDVAAAFREHAPFVWRALRSLGVGEADCDDLCQEVFVTAHKKLPDFEGRSTLRTWLYGIAVRKASAHRRAARTRREDATEPSAAEAAPTSDSDSPHEKVARREARAILDHALEGLDDDKRAVFVLYEVEQLAMSEVAEVVGCPLQTAYSRLHAARKQVEAAVKRAAMERRPA